LQKPQGLQKPQASEQGVKGAAIAFYCYGAKEHAQKTLLFKDAREPGRLRDHKFAEKYGLCFNCPGASLAVIHDLKDLILLRQKAERFSYDANGKNAWNS